MFIMKVEVQEVMWVFVCDYFGVFELVYKFCEDVVELYGL